MPNVIIVLDLGHRFPYPHHFHSNRDILGLGFQPITSFVALALLHRRDCGRLNLLGYSQKHVICCLRECTIG